jgi:hypothetical protein
MKTETMDLVQVLADARSIRDKIAALLPPEQP